MSLGTSNRDGGKTSESGHLRALAKIVSGDVIEGLNAVQRAAGVNMSVDVQVGDAFVRRSDGTYAHPVFNDAVYNQVISAADGSNPRRDIVVIYVDYGQSPSTAVSNNTNGVVKIKVVNGTPAGSPVDPNAAAIQASVGSGNPYSILARVRVPAGQTSISNSLIDDLRTMITSNATTVNTAAIQASAVTTPKIANASVTPDKLATGALTAQVATSQTTTSVSYADLATVGPAVTAAIGANGMALVVVSGWTSDTIATAMNYMAFTVSGATTIAALDTYAANIRVVDNIGGAINQITASYLVTGLTPGSNTFTAKYKTNAGTATFADRKITVIPL